MKLELLKKMKHKMPESPKDDMLEADISELDMEAEDMPEAPEAEGPLSGASDEDLLAEVRKRGLSLEGEQEGSEMDEAEDMEEYA
jgi:hypothetical protein